MKFFLISELRGVTAAQPRENPNGGTEVGAQRRRPGGAGRYEVPAALEPPEPQLEPVHGSLGRFSAPTPEPELRAQAEEPQGIALGEPLNVISRPADLPDRPGHTLPYASELCTQYRRRGLKKCVRIV